MTISMQNDGCTGWFDGWPGGPSWRHCCDAHDWAMHTGLTLEEWVAANADLGACVWQIDSFIAVFILVGVFSPIGAWLFFFGDKKGGARTRIAAFFDKLTGKGD
jgi:hypothetical protein